MKMTYRHAMGLFCLWFFLMAVSLYSRYYLPIDETRYVTVAWNMWLRGDFLVPFLNDQAYSHKPPLLFWLMHLGWLIFGVNDWWPRLVPSFFGLGGVFLTIHIAKILWPGRDSTARMASVILLGSLLWMVFATVTMFDMLVAFFTLLGMLGLLIAWRGSFWKGWLLVAVAIGLGLLAKGPAILLHILPAALLAPWWGRKSDVVWCRWYWGVLAAVILGAIIALIWAIPAGIRGGEVYWHAIFWGQTADRMVNSFSHQRPFWWYTVLMPLMLFPWLLWGGAWRGLVKLREDMGGMGVRFCLAWAVPVFLAFSLISGKQVHYLLPIFPAFALLVARGLDSLEAAPGRMARLGVTIFIMLTGIMLLIMPHLSVRLAWAEWMLNIPVSSGMALLLCGVILIAWRPMCIERQVWLNALASLVMVLVLHFAIIHTAGLAYDVRPISTKIKALQDAGVSLANDGKYPGQYQFAGRLIYSIEETDASNFSNWFDAHPDGRIIFYFKPNENKSFDHDLADFIQPYRGGSVGIYSREALLPSP